MRLLQDIDMEKLEPTLLFCYNKVAMHIAANPIYHEKIKHIEN